LTDNVILVLLNIVSPQQKCVRNYRF